MKISPVDTVPQMRREHFLENSSKKAPTPEKNVREEKSTEKQVVSEEQVIRAIEKANDSLALTETKFEFSIHEETKQIMVKVLNKETDEVIREIPPEKILDMIASIWELAGLFVDEKV